MTPLVEKLGLSLPIMQAPMAGVSTPALAAAVSNAGALGSIAVGATDVAGAREMIQALRQLTRGPVNINVFCHGPPATDAVREAAWLKALAPEFERFGAEPPPGLREIYRSFLTDPEMLELLIQARPCVVSFHFGLPSPATIVRLKSADIFLFATATNVEEARQAAVAGVDAIVAQGCEAGGHRGVFDPAAPDEHLGVVDLTRQLVERVGLPVIAAGGLMDGADIAAVLELGAQAAQLGTAFVGCPESSADGFHRAALFGPEAHATEITRVISGRPARSLPNRFTQLGHAALAGLAIPDYPIAYDAAKALAAAAREVGDGSYGAPWAGQGAPRARRLPAADLLATLAAEMVAARR
jgi:nitronate monooxygenase